MALGERSAATIAIGPERTALAETLRRFVADRCPSTVVRHAVESGDRGVPDYAKEMAELGWFGLHIPAKWGGQGHGSAEAVLVAEEFARATAPGPLLSTLATGLVLRIAAAVGDDLRSPDPVADWLRGLAAGEMSAAILHTRRPGPSGADDASSDRECASDVLSAPTVGAGEAELFVVRAGADDAGDDWRVVNACDVVVRPIQPLDLTRSVAEVTISSAVLDAAPALPGVDRAIVDAALATFAAAECAGVASWCVATAAGHATERRQFGRVIGQFQAVKHRCADMLVAAEATRAVAWDAAAAADTLLTTLEGADGPDAVVGARDAWLLASSAAATIALDAAVQVAEDCIQVLGGIGFTWEHDAHLHLRRAVALRQQLGGTSRWRRGLATLALSGTRRRLRVDVPPEAEPMRVEIRANASELAALEPTAQRARMVELGYLIPNWPEPWGLAADATTQLLIDAELRRAKVTRPHLQVGAWAAPTIAAHGTVEQQERWVRPTLLGQITWCQLFSEPEAGSDLAGLRTRATRVAGGWSVTGQKVWTTMAAEADWGICLVRTDTSAPKHAGISYLILDMKSPGIEVRPLREMTGLEMFNEVFLTDVFVPDDCVIGSVNEGWAMARTTLGNERVSMGSGSSFGGGVENLLGLVRCRRDDPETDGGVGCLDAVIADRVGRLMAEAHAVAALGARSTLRSLVRDRPGPEASIRKLLGVEHDQRVQEFGLDLLGPAGTAIEGAAATWTFGFLANRCLTIAGGTSEIQRNVIAERLLGLPRDPEPDTAGDPR